MENYTETKQNFSQLDDVITNIKKDHNWLNGELGFTVLQQNPDNNVVIIVMHENTEFESFQANNTLVLKVIHGKLKFKIRDKETIIESGKVLILQEHLFYLIESMEESVFLLMTFTRINKEKSVWIC
ncbi:MAG: hypothetical protein ACM3PX_03605 [Omnitrophica WOR_2 bacterium]|jgi:hypothetical protein